MECHSSASRLLIKLSILWTLELSVTSTALIGSVRGFRMSAVRARTLVLGHRGAPARAPENTLRSYRLAAELGADGIEVDVQRCVDGRLPLIHDDLVDRTTNGSGRVALLDWTALSALDAGDGERIPLLEDLLAFAAARPSLFLDLELKMPGVGLDTLDALARARHAGPIALSSFDYDSLVEARRLDAAVELWLLAGTFEAALLARAQAVAASCLALEVRSIGPAVVDAVARAGLGLVAWTVNEPADLERLLAIEPPLRAVVTNYPERALAARATREGNSVRL